jgi:hypothetical protein
MKKILLVGGRGISEVFVRLLKKHNISEIGLISSTYETTKTNAKALTEKYKIIVSPLKDLGRNSINFSPQGVIIAAPNHCHEKYLTHFIKAGIPILCEKPLFWQEYISAKIINDYFKFLAEYKTSNLFLNTSNRFFAKAAKGQFPNLKESKSFELTFNTHGNAEYENIGIDLLPHAFSILHELFGFNCITQVKLNSSNVSFNAKFKYGKINVSFYLSENIKKAKYFGFSADKNKFERSQIGFGNTYSVYLLNKLNQQKIKLEDPFDTNIQRLLNLDKIQNFAVDDFLLAQQNMLDCFEIISEGQK